MRPRTLARRLAFQYMYIYDLNRGVCENDVDFLDANTDVQAVRDHARLMVRMFIDKREAIDRLLQAAAKNYSIARIAAVERNVMRLGVVELIEGVTPFKVAIDEAVKIAKKFGGKDSARFVNGILDAVARELQSGAR